MLTAHNYLAKEINFSDGPWLYGKQNQAVSTQMPIYPAKTMLCSFSKLKKGRLNSEI